MAEYNNSTVGSTPCSYATLGNYTGEHRLHQSTLNNASAASTQGSQGHYVVPAYGGISYDTLMHGESGGSCSGYFNVMNAYGRGAANCNQKYMRSPCGKQ